MSESTKINVFDGNCVAVEEQYLKDNYIIRDYDNDSDLVVIYFASNGLYYPDTLEEFSKVIIENDRYEWMHYRIQNVRREIYVRDIHKSWYLKGINKRINTIDKLIELIGTLIPDGCRLVTVGNSAGGYAAALVGTMLKADYVFDFSGQMSLNHEKRNPIVTEYIGNHLGNGVKENYLSLDEVWKKHDIPAIFYFYSAGCDYDILQWSSIGDEAKEKIHRFAFDTVTHERTMYNFNYLKVLNYGKDRLVAEADRYKGRIISRMEFSLKTCGVFWTIGQLLKKGVRKIVKMVRAEESVS